MSALVSPLFHGEPLNAKRHLTCCCCGACTGSFEQHWNQDTGWGICRPCVNWISGRWRPRYSHHDTLEDELKSLYGVEGVNDAGPDPNPDPQPGLNPNIDVIHE